MNHLLTPAADLAVLLTAAAATAANPPVAKNNDSQIAAWIADVLGGDAAKQSAATAELRKLPAERVPLVEAALRQELAPAARGRLLAVVEELVVTHATALIERRRQNPVG